MSDFFMSIQKQKLSIFSFLLPPFIFCSHDYNTSGLQMRLACLFVVVV